MTLPESPRAPLTTVTVGTAPRYQIHVGPGASRQIPGWLASHRIGVRYALITDSNVAELHAVPLRALMAESGLSVETVAFPAGERHKTRATKEQVEDALVAAGLRRDAALIALGGGVVGDLAGFVAATYMRGIPYVQVPTTLLAMVDASVGGKTAVDHPAGKNLIGAFHQPAAVFIDTHHLGTLPDRELRSGLAEVLKAAVVRDGALFSHLISQTGRIAARDPDLLAEVVARACRIKAEVVAADERESDLRKILNFGHTIGHAVETLSGYSLAHGEAVAIGMVAESRIAAACGLLDDGEARAIEAAVETLGLPVRLPQDMSVRSILQAAALDKKARSGRLVCALPAGIGRMARGSDGYGLQVEPDMAARVLEAMRPAAPAP